MSLPPEEKPSAPRVVPLYTDEVLGIVMKPAGLLVHRSEVAPNAEAFSGAAFMLRTAWTEGLPAFSFFPLIRKRRQPLPVSLRPGS